MACIQLTQQGPTGTRCGMTALKACQLHQLPQQRHAVMPSPSIICCAGLQGGWNRAAVLALLGGIAPTLPGLLQEVGLLQNIASWLRLLYSASWFVGTLTGSAMYVLLTRRTPSSSISVVQDS